MADNHADIQISFEEFQEFYTEVADIITQMGNAYMLSQHIITDTMLQKDGGKDFYIAPTKEILATYYAYLSQNISQLNSFYSKAFEYLMYIAEQMKFTDEQLSAALENHFGGESC